MSWLGLGVQMDPYITCDNCRCHITIYEEYEYEDLVLCYDCYMKLIRKIGRTKSRSRKRVYEEK